MSIVSPTALVSLLFFHVGLFVSWIVLLVILREERIRAQRDMLSVMGAVGVLGAFYGSWHLHSTGIASGEAWWGSGIISGEEWVYFTLMQLGLSLVTALYSYFKACRRRCPEHVLVIVVIVLAGVIATLVTSVPERNVTPRNLVGAVRRGRGFPIAWLTKVVIVYWEPPPPRYYYSWEALVIDWMFWCLIISVVAAVAFRFFQRPLAHQRDMHSARFSASITSFFQSALSRR